MAVEASPEPAPVFQLPCRSREGWVEGDKFRTLDAIPSIHLHLLVPKEKEDEEAGPSLQGQAGPAGLPLPASAEQGVADDMGLGGVEARVEVDGDVRLGAQAAATLEVHLKPLGEAALKRCSGRRPSSSQSREEPLA